MATESNVSTEEKAKTVSSVGCDELCWQIVAWVK